MAARGKRKQPFRIVCLTSVAARAGNIHWDDLQVCDHIGFLVDDNVYCIELPSVSKSHTVSGPRSGMCLLRIWNLHLIPTVQTAVALRLYADVPSSPDGSPPGIQSCTGYRAVGLSKRYSSYNFLDSRQNEAVALKAHRDRLCSLFMHPSAPTICLFTNLVRVGMNIIGQ